MEFDKVTKTMAVQQDDNCMCREAVERSYREMTELGQSDSRAFGVATRIYTHYHPDVPEENARRTIAEWLDPST